MSRQEETPAPASTIRRVLGQVAVSAAIWCVFGMVVGVCTAPDLKPITVVANLIAGVIVLTPFGALMGLFGGRWLELLAGGALGFAGGVLLAVARGEPCGYSAGLGMVFGGLVGATVISVFWRLPRRLKRALVPTPSDTHVQQPVLA